VPSRNGDTLADRVSKKVLSEICPDYKVYSWLERGSDERQYCAPGVDLPVASIMRSKYGEYPEYHTSLDDLSLVTPDGLYGGFRAIQAAINMLENNGVFKVRVLCEPQLGKRGLYPNTSTKNFDHLVQNQMNVLSYLDGNLDLISVAEKCDIAFVEILDIIKKLVAADLVERV
jgi:aminopeptidase-like protein